MELKLCLFIICSMLLFQHTNAQVTIGSNNPPAEFAALQIDGVNQGLRLSRLSTTDRDKLNVSGVDAARGLVIYNTTNEAIEFYDGSVWRPLAKSLEFENGIHKDVVSGKVLLGGNLTEPTTIIQGTNPMNFTTGTGIFSVNTNVLAINNSTVAADVNNFTVNNGINDVFKITKTGATTNSIEANVGTAGLDVNSGTLNIAGTKTTVDGTFTYKDGTQGAGKVLMSNANGVASWGTLSPSTTYKTFPISLTEGTQTSTGTSLSTSSFNAITSTNTLEAGKWIITGMLYTYTNQATNSSSVYLIRMRLYDVTNSKALYVTGDLPESKNATPGYTGGSFSAIPMTCFVEVPSGETWTVRIDAYTDRSSTYLIKNYNWLNPGKGSEFKAMRVND